MSPEFIQGEHAEPDSIERFETEQPETLENVGVVLLEDDKLSAETLEEINKLRAKVEELELEIERIDNETSAHKEGLMPLEDEIRRYYHRIEAIKERAMMMPPYRMSDADKQEDRLLRSKMTLKVSQYRRQLKELDVVLAPLGKERFVLSGQRSELIRKILELRQDTKKPPKS